MAIGWRCGDMVGTTSAGEEMKNNKVVARGEEKLYISAANSKRLYIFPIRRRRPFSSRRKKKNDPSPPTQQINDDTALVLFVRRGVIYEYIAEVLCLPKTYTYTWCTIILVIRWPRAISNKYLNAALKRVGVHRACILYYCCHDGFERIARTTAISAKNVQNFPYA